MDFLKKYAGGLLGGVVGLLLGAFLFGGSDDGMGGVYEITQRNFTDMVVSGTADINGVLDIDATAVTFGAASATSSINFGRLCGTVTSNDGDTVYVFFNNVGTLATSSSSCN